MRFALALTLLSACAPKLGELDLPLEDAIDVPLGAPCEALPGNESLSVLGVQHRGGFLYVEVGYGTGCGTEPTFLACESTRVLPTDPPQIELLLGAQTDNTCRAEGFRTLRIAWEDACDTPSSIGSSAVRLSCD